MADYLTASIQSLNVVPTLDNKISVCIDEKDENFKVLSLNTASGAVDGIKHHIILTIDRSGSMSNGNGKETKIDQTKHTLTNILRWILENSYSITCSVIIFDNEVDVLFEYVTVTKENIVDFISIINVDVYARNTTNIGDAFAKVDKISKQYEDEHVKTSHIFMTDGIPTSGITDRVQLVEKLPSIDYQYFIGFGLDHDVTLLSMFADKFANSYYFVDSIENTGNIYGEILHNIVNNLVEEITISSEVYTFYNTITNTWENALTVSNMAIHSTKHIHIKSLWKDQNSYTNHKNLVSIDYKLSKFMKDEMVYKVGSIHDIVNYKNVYKFLWKQAVLELLYKYKTNLAYSKAEIKTLMDNMRAYITDHNLSRDEFMKVLLDDLYITYKTWNTAEARIYVMGRHESSSNERAVMINSIDNRFSSKPMFISRSFTGNLGYKDDDVDDNNDQDSDLVDYQISQDMNSLNLTMEQHKISRSVSAPAVKL